MRNIKIFLQFAKYKTVLALFFTFPSFAQQTSYAKKIDSLLQLVKVCKEDTTKVNLYFEVCGVYRKSDITKVAYYNNILLKLSKKEGFNKGIAHFHFNNSVINSMTGQFKIAISDSDQAAKLYKAINDDKSYLMTFYPKAQSLFKLGNLKLAKKIANEGIIFAKNHKLYSNTETLYYLLGCIFNSQNQSNAALHHFQIALQLFRKNNKRVGIIACYNEITVIYLKNKQLDLAIKYIESALEISTVDDHKTRIYLSLKTNNAKAYSDNGNYEKAKKIAISTLKKSKVTNDSLFIAHNCNTIAYVLCKQKKYNQSLIFAENAIKYIADNEVNNETNSIIIANLVGLNKHQSAKELAILVLKNIIKNNLIEHDFEIYLTLSNIEFSLRNYKNASEYKDLYIFYSQLLNSKNETNRVSEFQYKFNVVESNLKFKNLSLEQKNKEIEIKRNYILMLFQFVLLLFFLIISFFLFFYFKKMKKKNYVIEEINKKLITGEAIIKNDLEIKTILLNEIHHRVKNNLQLIMSLLNIQAHQQNFTTIEHFIEKSQLRIASLSLVHENLHLGGKTEKVNVQQYIISLVQNIKNCLTNSSDDIEFEIKAKNILLSLETTIPLGIIINEFTTNAIKYAFENQNSKKINIQLTQKNNDFVLVFADNGKKSDKNTKKSVGLTLVKLLISQLKANMHMCSQNGYRYTISFNER